MATHHHYLARMIWGTIALAACGGGKDQPAPGAVGEQSSTDRSSVEACSLLTAEDIATVTGVQAQQVVPDTFGTVGTCNYNVTGQPLPVVSVILAPSMPDVSSSAEMVTWRKSQVGSSYGDIKFIFEPVEGLGVPAIRNEVEGMGLVTVEAAVKGMLLDVTTASLEMSKALIPMAMARLP